MKTLDQLSESLLVWRDKKIKRLIEAQKITAEQVHKDVLINAPHNTGEYASSIKVSETTYENNVIRTSIYTDMTSADDGSIVIGRMIEHGTGIYALEPHIGHTKTFKESGYQYWYVPAKSVKRAIGRSIFINGVEFYVAYAQPAKPHFLPALQKNKSFYLNEIRKAMRK